MERLLRETWIFIVAPLVLVLLGLVALLVFRDRGASTYCYIF